MVALLLTKHQDINPEIWLLDVLGRIHLQPIKRIEELFLYNRMLK
jgi:hypothetical protein